VRALVVGYGSVGRRHVDNLRACGAKELVVQRPSGASQPQATEGLRFVSTLAEGLACKPDLAVIASPSSAHAEALEFLLHDGVPCYVEKPPVTSAAAADRVAMALAAADGLVTITGCNLRFLPSLRRLRDRVREGLIGAPVRASFQAGQWLPDWRPGRDYRETYSAHTAHGGGVIFDLIHELDCARWMFGEFDEVRALSGKLSRLEIDSEDVACILLARRDGPLVSVSLDYVSRKPVRRYDIVGDEGTLTWDLGAKELTLGTPAGVQMLDRDPMNFDIASTYLAAMREFVEAVRSGRKASPDLADGLATTRLALRAKV
jgi:predicted dehydrogenase